MNNASDDYKKILQSVAEYQEYGRMCGMCHRAIRRQTKAAVGEFLLWRSTLHGCLYVCKRHCSRSNINRSLPHARQCQCKWSCSYRCQRLTVVLWRFVSSSAKPTSLCVIPFDSNYSLTKSLTQLALNIKTTFYTLQQPKNKKKKS